MPKVLLYHDVVSDDDDASGFRGGGAARYKLRNAEFDRHLCALAAAHVSASTLPHLSDPAQDTDAALLITFDDGGVSAITSIADRLERFGWRGHFLITVDYVGSSGFLSAGQVRDLDRRGHTIGSHSCSHPTRMAACTRAQLLDEWRRSKEVLCDIVGKSVTVASIPGGYYSRAVAETAAEAGLKHLFTSEPTIRTWDVENCRVYGRYTIYRGTPPSTAAAIAEGSLLPRLQQTVAWKFKKALKTIGGLAYLQTRQYLLDRRY